MRTAEHTGALAVGALSLLLAVPYALMGANFILDDWWALRNAAFDGAFAAGGPDQLVARPGAWLIYALEFGLLGRHPLAVYVLQSVLNAGVAVLLFVVLRRFLPYGPAAAAAAVWVVLPNHTSLGRWASTMNIVVSLGLLLLGIHALAAAADRQRRPWLGALLLVGSALCYEATIPAAAVMAVGAPMLRRRRLRPGDVAVVWASLAVVVLWLVTHWHPAKQVGSTNVDLSPMFPAHFGWGVLGHGPLAEVASLVALAGIALSVARVALPSYRRGAGLGERMVLAGLAIIVVGTVPFLRYIYSPLGAGDRVNVVAAVGAALAWTGLGMTLWRTRVAAGRVAVGLGGVVLTVLMIGSGVHRDSLYARAGDDVLATLHALDRAQPHPAGPIAIGPEPLIEDNVAGLLDGSVTTAALQAHRGTRDVAAYVTLRPADFWQAPAELRFDQRTIR